ncbi:hypothetical protein BDR06DRAFT_948701 [Suillus hirtellus]|nr:hypothetical protein BDR06DRAFT_948701 [Suillus hirtellus]
MHLLVPTGDHATVKMTSGMIGGPSDEGLVGTNRERFSERTTKIYLRKGSNRTLQISRFYCESITLRVYSKVNTKPSGVSFLMTIVSGITATTMFVMPLPSPRSTFRRSEPLRRYPKRNGGDWDAENWCQSRNKRGPERSSEKSKRTDHT